MHQGQGQAAEPVVSWCGDSGLPRSVNVKHPFHGFHCGTGLVP